MVGRKRLKMKADKGQFDEVLRRMIEKNPQKTAEIEKQNVEDARTRGFRLKKNPHTGPIEPEPETTAPKPTESDK